METTDLKLQFVIDGKIGSKVYTLDDIMNDCIDYSRVIEDMEECTCSLNESTNHCEGDCIKYGDSKVTGVIII